MAEKLRFGLIGSGSQGRYLSEAAKLTGRAELVACADVKPEATRLAMERCGYRESYSNYHEMLSEEKLDAVIVARTHDELQPAALAAVKAGKHALVEKPMALNAAAGRELVNAAREKGVKLMVGYSLRCIPERVHLKRLLDDGAVGKIIDVFSGVHISVRKGWLTEPQRGGGALFYIGCHAIDQVLWVVKDKVQRVFAEIEWRSPESLDDDALITMRFADGALGQVSCSHRFGGRYGWLDVLGTEGRLRLEWENDTIFVESRKIEAYRHPTHIRVPVNAYIPPVAPDAKATLTSYKYIRAWIAELNEFISAIVKDRDPAVTGEDGVRVLEVIDAAIESARSGKSVEIAP